MFMNIVSIQDNQPNFLQIYYDLSNICNYKCWYCFPGSNEGTDPWPDPNIVKENIVHLVKYYKENSKIKVVEINFIGGEPTLWKHLGEVAEYIKTHVDCRVCMLTNGSRTLRWWHKYSKYFDNIGISVHHERADIDHLIEVGNILYKNKINFNTAVLMDHKNWNKCIDIVNKLCDSKNKWTVIAKAVHINGVNYYNREQIEYLKDQVKRAPQWFWYLCNYNGIRKKFKVTQEDGKSFTTKNPNYFSMHKLNYFKGWQCTLGVNFLFISKDGKITGSCGQKLYGLDYYFNIKDKDFRNKFNPKIVDVICEQNICCCSGEAALTKRKL